MVLYQMVATHMDVNGELYTESDDEVEIDDEEVEIDDEEVEIDDEEVEIDDEESSPYYAAYLPLPRMLNWKWNEAVPEDVRKMMSAEVPIPKSLAPVKSPNVHERDSLGRRTLLWATLHHEDISRNRDKYRGRKIGSVPKSISQQLYYGKKYQFFGDVGHIIARTLGGSDSLDNLFLQNTEVNHSMGNFENSLTNILLKYPKNKAEMFWRFSYDPNNSTTIPDVVTVSLKLTVNSDFTGETSFRYRNKRGPTYRLAIANSVTTAKAIDGEKC
ncbi:hypothetical protein WR25_07730 [Diploscapter pachys]|uniref:Type VII secretion system protein EssD-like domain-containing protein n=1 Tax=Diploscapter pachys TaxID=2018661 RepID=A0A2A2KYI5_9BILA|nr:hypothetical protein WR25_07730 [Diploscapter pachys]